MYALYFEKDQATALGGGHRHDVESFIIMFYKREPVAAGTSAHGKYDFKSWSDVPKKEKKKSIHAKVVSHKEVVLTHAFRFAKAGEDEAENPYKEWVFPNVASWFEMVGDDGVTNEKLCTTLENYNFGKAVWDM